MPVQNRSNIPNPAQKPLVLRPLKTVALTPNSGLRPKG
jgi:hypothetical protein